MENSSRRFGIEFELSGFEPGGQTIPSPARNYFAWHSDGSIRNKTVHREEECVHCGQMEQRETRLGTAELVVNPPQHLDFYLEDEFLPMVLDHLKTANPHLDCSPEYMCSAHLHVSISDDELLPLAEYAIRHEREVFERWQPAPRRVESFAKKFSCNSSNTASYIANRNSDRYFWLNLKPAFDRHQTAEFRLFNGTLDVDEIRLRIAWCLDFVRLAKQEHAERTAPSVASMSTGDVPVRPGRPRRSSSEALIEPVVVR
jgi:hypothetical protein